MTLLRFLAVTLAVLLAACGNDKSTGNAVDGQALVVPTDPHAIAQRELEKPSLELQRFVAVRIQDGDRRLEASPMAPAIVADTRLGEESIKTLFRVNPEGDKLILFTRDVFNARSHRTEILLTELQQQQSFTFPVVQPDGSLKAREFKLLQIVRPE
ncbi:hypothetical protein AZSI13_16040 [Azospira sp. I13]|uniref:hypothetical protein n=1 Tax=Azospira sp. I13 TaxID=1765050 RepID=UPI000D4A27D8|nr:hypothetical protein [Azospira sp. I13]GBG02277.1 hypothetical protein AZSI13_16040 [Azospira sp. I13]